MAKPNDGIIELILVKVLDYDWSEVHDEAEQLEHAISDKLLERIDRFLGYPKVDPHGDPIPTHEGEMIDRQLIDLTKCKPGQQATVSRVMDQESDFLQYLDRQGLVPGTGIKIIKSDSIAEAMTLENSKGEEVTLGLNAAQKVLVELP